MFEFRAWILKWDLESKFAPNIYFVLIQVPFKVDVKIWKTKK